MYIVNVAWVYIDVRESTFSQNRIEMIFRLKGKRMNLNRSVLWLFILLFPALARCAAVNTAPLQRFDFSPLIDSPDVHVLDWRYSEYGAQAWQVQRAANSGQGAPGLRVTGNFPVGEFIYVKWQVPPDPTIYERRIELKGLLPWSMEGNGLVMIFRSAQPHVYLIKRGREGACPGSACPMTLPSDTEKIARVFSRDSVTQIYPGPPTPIVIPLPKRPSE
jgi:hypothetical protein